MNLAYTYNIVLDKSKDVWNWLDSSRKPNFCGFSWRAQLSGSSLDFFNKIVDLPSESASKKIEDFLDALYERNRVFFDKQYEKISNRFSGQFLPSCKWIEETTKKPLFFNFYNIYLTTFPRSPYDSDNGAFFFNIYRDNGLANVFLHEVLHFQFIHYWRDDKSSLVHSLSDDEFEFLKESLTVIIDSDAVPPADFVETGYIQQHKEFRKILHKYWLKNHDFEKLIAYGLKKIPDFLIKNF